MQRKIKQATPLMDQKRVVVRTQGADPQPQNLDPTRKDPIRLHLKNPVELTAAALAEITTKKKGLLDLQSTLHIKAILCIAYCVTSNIHRMQNFAQQRETSRCKTPVMHKNASR